MSHKIKTEKFEGPIGVLYNLIEERKMSISDFSLVAITEEFIKYIKEMSAPSPGEGLDFNKEEVSQFISIASVLILLKSKSLIPELELTEEEDRDIAILENQLKAFELLKGLSKWLAKNWQKNENVLLTGKINYKNVNSGKVFVPDRQMNLSFFNEYIKNRLNEIVPKEIENKEIKVHKNLKIDDALSHVRDIIKRLKNLNFKNLGDSGDERLRDKNKRNVVILFLAVLELMKIGEIDATQDDNFGDILVEETQS